MENGKEIVLKYEAEYEISKHDEDSGFDVRCTDKFSLMPGDFKTISLGIKLEIPKGYEVQLRPRSGLNAKGILLQLGTIDEGYRGILKAVMINLSTEKISFNRLDRVGQIVVSKLPSVKAVKVDKVKEDTKRASNGFGSTGIK